MSDAISILSISVLSCICVFLLQKEFRSKGSGDNGASSSESTPLLLKQREIQLEEDQRCLREDQLKQEKLDEAFQEKFRKFKSEKAAIIEKEKALQNVKAQHDAEWAVKTKDLEEREFKLNDEVESFQAERLVQAKILSDEMEQRRNEVESLELKLKEQTSLLRVEQTEQERLKADLASRIQEVEERESKLKIESQELEEQRIKQEALDKSLLARLADIEARERALENNPSAAPVEVATTTEESPKTTEVSEEEAEVKPVLSQEPVLSDAETRKKMIEDDLERLIDDANKNELDEDNPFDEDSIEALKQGAFKVCYRKKYYDVMNDKFVFFPSVARAAVDYRLIEEAEKFYFEEEDEYPTDLTSALRTVATTVITEEEDDDFDEDYMSKLAQDVVV